MKNKFVIFKLFLITVLFLLSSAAVFPAAAALLSKEESELISQGVESYYSGEYQAAADIFSDAEELENISDIVKTDIIYYSAAAAVKMYNTEKAVEQLQKLEAMGVKHAGLYWAISELYLNKEGQFDSADFEMALNYLKEAEALGFNSKEFSRDLAYAYRELGEIDKAENIYTQLIRTNPSAEDYLNLAQLINSKENYTKAAEYYERALAAGIQRQSLYLNLAQLYNQLEYYEEAVKIYREGIKLQPEFTAYYVGLAESYISLENYNQAEDALLQAVDINPKLYYVYYLLGEVSREKDDYNQALIYYADSLKNNPDYVKAYLAEGQIHLENEDYYKAISRFSLAVEKNPEFADSHYYLGLAYYRAGMEEAAAAEFRRTLHLSENYPEARELLDKIEDN